MKGAPSLQQIAEACGVHMHEVDPLARALGIALDEIAPGRSRVSMTVREVSATGFRTDTDAVVNSMMHRPNAPIERRCRQA